MEEEEQVSKEAEDSWQEEEAADKGQAGLALHPMMMVWGRSLIKCFETHNLKSSIPEFESVLYQLSDSLNLSSLSIKH